MKITRDASLNPNNDTEICRMKRHPIGIYQLYISMGFAYLIIFVLLIYGIPASRIHFTGGQLGLLWLCFVFAGLVSLTFLLIARHIYWGSELCVTDSGVSQVKQLGLFNRKVSRLDMEKVEDVTATQRGILQSMFNFGTLEVETAGAEENFTFPYCPNPNKMAQDIHTARQAYLERHMYQTAQTHAAQIGQALNNLPPQQVVPVQPGQLDPQAYPQAAPAPQPADPQPAYPQPPVQPQPAYPEQPPVQPATPPAPTAEVPPNDANSGQTN